MTVYKLRKFYKERKIKKKLVKIGKVLPPRALPRAAEDAMNLADDVRGANLQGFRILQIDEAMYTKRVLPKFDWSKKHKNASIDWQKMDTGALAVVAAISREQGVEMAMIFPKSLNVSRFKIFLDNLRAAHPFDDIMLVMDNLSVHKN